MNIPRRQSRGGSAGFTLIEILVVVVIVGIIVTFATLSIGNRALDDRLETESERLQQILQLASEEAETKGIELGFRYTADGYAFYTTGKAGKWEPYPTAGPLRPRQLPQPFYLELQVEGRPVPPAVDAQDGKDVKIEPQFLLLSSGEIMAARLDLKAPGYAPYYRIECSELGKVTRTRIEDGS